MLDENHVHVGEEMIVSISSNKKVIQKNLLLKGANELQIRESPNFTKFLSLAKYKEMKILKKKLCLSLEKPYFQNDMTKRGTGMTVQNELKSTH